MTLELNYQKDQQTRLLQHIQWLLEIGLIESYDLKEKEEIEVSEEDVEALLKARQDVKNGNFLTHEEVKTKFSEWRKSR
jgi:cell division protein FtsX